MDRGWPGVKRHLVVDAKGTRLAVLTGPANQHDSQMLAPTLDAIPAIRSDKRGRQRRRPDKLHADKGYDYPGVARNAVPAVSVPVSLGAVSTAANAWDAIAGWSSVPPLG